MKTLIALVFGFVFGAGLVISGMISPDRVKGFLDVTGAWDPSLGFVMGGAVLTAAPFFAIARGRKSSAASQSEPDLPADAPIDGRLISGAAIFGIGWGLSGICPGPAIVNLAIAPLQVLPFILAMAVGLLVAQRV